MANQRLTGEKQILEQEKHGFTVAVEEMTGKERELWGTSSVNAPSEDLPRSIYEQLVDKYGRKICRAETCTALGKPQHLDQFERLNDGLNGERRYKETCNSCKKLAVAEKEKLKEAQRKLYLLLDKTPPTEDLQAWRALSTTGLNNFTGELISFTQDYLQPGSTTLTNLTKTDRPGILLLAERLQVACDQRDKRARQEAAASEATGQRVRISAERYVRAERGVGICNNKWCTMKGLEQPLENFSVDHHNNTGHNIYCKKCSTALSRIGTTCGQLYSAIVLWFAYKDDSERAQGYWDRVVAGYKRAEACCDKFILVPHDSRAIIIQRVDSKLKARQYHFDWSKLQ